MPAFHEAYFQPLIVNIFFSALFADYERRSSGSHDHEESRAMLAQKIEKETVGDRNTAQSIGRSRGREQGRGSKGREQTFNASSRHFPN